MGFRRSSVGGEYDTVDTRFAATTSAMAMAMKTIEEENRNELMGNITVEVTIDDSPEAVTVKVEENNDKMDLDMSLLPELSAETSRDVVMDFGMEEAMVWDAPAEDAPSPPQEEPESQRGDASGSPHASTARLSPSLIPKSFDPKVLSHVGWRSYLQYRHLLVVLLAPLLTGVRLIWRMKRLLAHGPYHTWMMALEDCTGVIHRHRTNSRFSIPHLGCWVVQAA